MAAKSEILRWPVEREGMKTSGDLWIPITGDNLSLIHI